MLALEKIGPEKPCATSRGMAPEWSMWAWVSTTASIDAGSTGNGAQLRSRRSLDPWYRPQSTSTRALGVSTRNLLPVTVPVPPRNVSTGTSGRFWPGPGMAAS